MKNISFKIYTLGCKVNQYDSGCLEQLLLQAGFSSVESRADLAIINTCAVTKTAILKDKRMVNLARKENPGAKIVVMGCWPKAYEIDEAVELVGKGKKVEETAKLIIKMCQPEKKGSSFNHAGSLVLSHQERSRYFIKIQDGCNQFCSYCIIPYTRGRLQSRPQSQIISEVKAAIAAGYQELVLSGIHLGLYGQEKPGSKINLTGLLKKLVKVKGLGRLRLSSIEITEVTDELIAFMALEPKMCQHLHISLQSGSDKILKAMNRPYSTSYFSKRVKRLRQAMPDIAISTDIIVGFPGETEADFIDTYYFSQEINFSKIHVFSFSAHEKTPAAKMDGKVNGQDIKDRSRRLRELSSGLESDYKKKILHGLKGEEIEVIVEGEYKGKLKGKTEFYFDIYFADKRRPESLVGKIVKVEL